MRRLLLALALLALPAGSAAPEGVLLDWHHGEALVGTTRAMASPLAEALPFAVDACRRAIVVDLLYEPAERGVHVAGVGRAWVPSELRLDLRLPDGTLRVRNVSAPAYGIPLGTVPAEGEHAIQVSLATGANVSWDLRVRGHPAFNELRCEPTVLVNEVEADPAGPDAGAEWVELVNLDGRSADLSLWTLEAGVRVVLPEGTTLAPHARLLVPFGPLPDADAVIVLEDAFARERDRTPALTDGLDSGHSWQRTPDGSAAWTFAPATPGTANG